MLVIGVRPETELAKTAGLELGTRGGIKVNENMVTRWGGCRSLLFGLFTLPADERKMERKMRLK